MTEHTPTPWHVGPHYKSDIESPYGRVAECGITRGPRAEADAEFICLAVNRHDALVAALKSLVTYSGCFCGDFGVGMGEDHTSECKRARAALKLAGGAA